MNAFKLGRVYENMKVAWGALAFVLLLLSQNVFAADCGGATLCDCGDDIVSDYNFSANLLCPSGVGLRVAVAGVTVNGNGFFMNGTNYGTGITVDEADGVTIANLTIKDYNRGIVVVSSSNTVVEYNTIIDTYQYGIYLTSSVSPGSCENNIVRGNTVIGNGNGIQTSSSDSNNITDNYVTNSTYDGIHLGGGILNIVHNNTVIENSDDGIYLVGAESNNITNNTVNKNKNGIYLSSYANNNTIADNTIADNVFDGILVYVSRNNTIEKNNVTGNNLTGIRLYSSDNTTVNENYACHNALDVSDNRATNDGDENTCTTVSGWDDTGNTGCSRMCPQLDSNASVSVGKTLLNGGQVFLGDTVAYLINITNTGETNITNMTIRDVYDVDLNYSGASITPADVDYVNRSLNWSLNQTLQVNESLTLYVNFTAILYAQIVSNNAEVTVFDEEGSQAQGSGSASISILKPGCAGANQTFSCGEDVNESCTLNHDLLSNGTCFNLTADDIVFDCAGYFIRGGDSGSGIYAEGRTNVSVINCVVANFSRGINFRETTNSSIVNNTVTESHFALYIYGSSSEYSSMNYNRIQGNNLTGNVHGIYLYYTSYNTVTDNVAQENSEDDVYVEAYRLIHCDNLVENNTGSGGLSIAYFNESVSIQDATFSQLILCDADNSTVRNVTLDGSPTLNNNGLMAFWTDYSSFSGITSNSNRYGIWLMRSSNNTLTQNTAADNDAGLYLVTYSDNNTITANNITNNQQGVWLSTAYNNTVAENTMEGNYMGAYIYSATDNKLLNNNITGSTLFGIDLLYGKSNNITGNNITLTSGTGIFFQLADSNNNTLNENYVCSNTLDISDEDSNTGDNNTCQTTSGYNDNTNGTPCTNPCATTTQHSTNLKVGWNLISIVLAILE